ncbi:MAG: hypothetical protein K2I70_04860, partial [Bacilli bacterium]|nr:hypothetical protein [Bacilli bacterium]
MSLKNRKKIMMSLLSLALATSGCASKNNENYDYYTDNYRENSHDVIDSILGYNSFYTEESSYDKDDYAHLYHNYLDKFINYMSKDQYSAFIDLVQNMNKEEYRMYPNSLAYLNSMFDVTENSYGRGFFKIFNSCILSENINYDGQVRIGGDIYNHINILIALVDNDEELFSSIFSGDINNVIECIIKNTGYKDRKAIEELILKIDLYTDLVLYNYYMDEKIRTSYEDRINEIIRLIIEAKRENYPDFGNTLYMKVLRDSIFYDKDKYMIYPGITTNTFRLKINDGKETYYTPYIDSSYLYGEDSIEKFKAIGVNNILSR